MSSFRKKDNNFEISAPGNFQHKGGLNKPGTTAATNSNNTPVIPLSLPPSLSTLKNTLKTSSDTNLLSVNTTPTTTTILKNNPTVRTNQNNNNNNNNHSNINNNQSQAPQQHQQQQTTGDTLIVKSNFKPMSGILQTEPSLSNNAKKTTKSTIISGKLKRFFKQRPSRESLYEKHILAAPFGSANLSYLNIFKILTALKKANAIESEGIFRVNGNAENIRTLWLGLNSLNEGVSCTASHHDLSGLLKLYLRETRFPLIPMELFVNGVVPSNAESIKEFIFEKLPDENVKILTALIDYLYKVTLETSSNKMNSLSLGVCFAPSLIRPISENNVVGISQIQSFCNFISTLIDSRLAIFSQKEVLPDISSSPIVTTTTTTTKNNSVVLPPMPSSNRASFHEDEYFIPPPPSFIVPNTIQEDSFESGHEEDDDDDEEGQQQTINPLYDEFINLLTDDTLGSSQKSIIIERMTYLFSHDSENFKNFLRDMGIEGIVSLLEYILTLDNEN